MKKNKILTITALLVLVGLSFIIMNACDIQDTSIEPLNTRQCTCKGYPILLNGKQYCIGINEVSIR